MCQLRRIIFSVRCLKMALSKRHRADIDKRILHILDWRYRIANKELWRITEASPLEDFQSQKTKQKIKRKTINFDSAYKSNNDVI